MRFGGWARRSEATYKDPSLPQRKSYGRCGRNAPLNWAVLDASFLMRVLLAGILGDRRAHEAFLGLGSKEVVAPTLLPYEVANALHRYVLGGVLSGPQAEAFLRGALGLNIRLMGDKGLHLRALALSQALGLKAVYDAHYLALAEKLQAEFWTADGKLSRKVTEAQVQGLLEGITVRYLEPHDPGPT
ncbi:MULTISPECIES: type II toxin-antitoxin system VapC family toxin [Thermus]|uniref:type II toxin-antitoxin system VapC family toxin n=1 Tax=Thermus TaxID=270 RepID=UPI002AA29BBC|nr:type II toxin-antitoxin system VapC family toxin [Thermus scotoductus]